MLRTFPVLMCWAVALWTFVGCAPPSASEAEKAAAGNEESTVTLSEAEIETLAEEQKVCAVTGEPLGSMGTPVPVRVTDSKGADHTVLLCCESCREELLENPDEHLAKLEAAKSEGTETE